MSPCFDRDRAESPRFEAHGSILQYRVEPDALRRRSAIWELVGPNVRRLLHASAPTSGASSAGTGSPRFFQFREGGSMKVRSYFPVTLTVDGEEISLRIKRMTMEEHSDFSTRLAKVGVPTYIRFVSRASSGPEQEQNEEGEYLISFEKIAEKRLGEMDAEKRAEYEAAAELDEKQAKEFLAYVAEQFVTVERGLIEETSEGEKSVTSGLDFLRIFGARRDVLQQLLEAVRQENELDAEQKKTWRSLIVSSPSSGEQSPDPVGPKPETTAENAATGGSANREDATGKPNGPHGSTDPSSSIPARS